MSYQSCTSEFGYNRSDITPHYLYNYGGPDNRSPLEKLMVIVLSLVIALAICSILGSCSSTKRIEDKVDISTEYQEYVGQQQHLLDSLYHIICKKDSLEQHTLKKDSSWQSTLVSDTTMVKDSTFVQFFADGSRAEYHWHWEKTRYTVHDSQFQSAESYDYKSQISTLNDSLQYYKHLYDMAITIVKTDTVSITSHHEVTKEEKHPWYFDILIHVYRACTIVLILTAIVWVARKGWFQMAFRFARGYFTGIF